MKEIYTSKGEVIKVDDADYDVLSTMTWHLSSNGYAKHAKKVKGKVQVVSMHRLLTGAEKGQYVDHINHDKIDNRRENLRICTPRENARHCRKIKGTKTKYKGVAFQASKGKYKADIRTGERRAFLGYFNTPEEAALAYNEAAIKYHGEFAVLNEVPDDRT